MFKIASVIVLVFGLIAMAFGAIGLVVGVLLMASGTSDTETARGFVFAYVGFGSLIFGSVFVMIFGILPHRCGLHGLQHRGS